MEEQGYNSVDEFRGLGLKYIAEMGEVQKEFKAQVGKLLALALMKISVWGQTAVIYASTPFAWPPMKKTGR